MNNIVDNIRGMNPYEEEVTRSFLRQRHAILQTLEAEGFEVDQFVKALKHAGYEEACDNLQKALKDQQLSSIQSAGQVDWDMLIDLVERFVPKNVAVDDPKQMAMYELYHRLKKYKSDPTSSTDTGSDWVSVETIPADSKDVLCTDCKRQWVGIYAHEKKIIVENDDDEPNDLDCDERRGECYLRPGWYECEECYGGTYDEVWMQRNPTHWMKLPNPPNTTNHANT